MSMDLNELERRQGGLAPVLMAVGGAVGVAGSLLTWASVQVTRGAGRQQRRLGGQGRTPGASGRAPGQGMPQGSLPQGRIGGGGRSFTIHGLDTTGGKIALAMFIALI